MPGQRMQHLGRAVRLVLFGLMSSAVFVNAVNAWAVRYPLISAGIAALEVLYRIAVPVETVESLTSAEFHTAPADPTGMPRTGIEVPRNADGTWGPTTVAIPASPDQTTDARTAPEG